MKYTVINLILDFDASTFPNLDMNYGQHTLATANVVYSTNARDKICKLNHPCVKAFNWWFNIAWR